MNRTLTQKMKGLSSQPSAISTLAPRRHFSGTGVSHAVIARLTATRRNGWKTIVEIHADASFTSFYRYYKQCGRRWSTKELIRVASRNEGAPPLNAHAHKPGLDLILQRLETYQAESNPIVTTKMRIIRKRAYRKLLNARPDELGMVRSRVNIPERRFSQLAGAG